MKKLIFAICILILVNSTHAQFSFSVKPGLSFNGASFGYRFGNIVGFINYDYNHVGGSAEITTQEFSYSHNSLVSFTDKAEASFSINNVGIGGKLFFPIEKEIMPYITLGLSKPFLSADLTVNDKPESSVSDFVADISVWGFNIGLGTEYYFTDHFSIGGEFGFRALLGDYSKNEKGTEEVYTNGSIIKYPTDNSYKVKINYSLTYSVISLNYYF